MTFSRKIKDIAFFSPPASHPAFIFVETTLCGLTWNLTRGQPTGNRCFGFSVTKPGNSVEPHVSKVEIYPNYWKVQRKFKFRYEHKQQFQQLGKSQAWLINTSIRSFSDLNSTVLQFIKRTVKLHLTKYIGSGSLKLKFL